MIQHTVTRRAFCQSVGLAAGGLAAGAWCDTQAAAPAFELRYIVGSCMYGKTPIAEILPEVAKSGAREIDIWPAPHGDQREQVDAMGLDPFAELLKQHNVTLGIITRYDLGPHRLADEMKVAKKLGAAIIVTGAGSAKGDSDKERVRTFVESLAPHVARAEAASVTIAIENHASSVIHSPDSLRYFAEAAKSQHLGIALAPYHLPQNAGLVAQLIRDLGPKMVHFYAWQHGKGSHAPQPKADELLQMPGRGPLDFKPILAALAETKYAGRTEIFMHPFPRGIAIIEPTSAVTDEINRARKYLAECLAAVRSAAG